VNRRGFLGALAAVPVAAAVPAAVMRLAPVASTAAPPTAASAHTASSAASKGGRLEWDGKRFRVYDAGGVKRIEIGDLS
jgi:phosphate-selective porin